MQKCLHKTISSFEFSQGWHDNTPDDCSEICLCKLVPAVGLSSRTCVSKCLLVTADFSWSMHVHGLSVDLQQCTALKTVPKQLNVHWFKMLVAQLDAMSVCSGNSDTKFTDMLESKNGKIVSCTGATTAYLDTICQKTVRCHNCTLLVEGTDRCSGCSKYRDNLRAIHSNYVKSQQRGLSQKCNLRYMNSSQKKRHLKLVQQALANKQRQLKRLKKRMDTLTEKYGIVADDCMQSDILNVLSKHNDEISKLPAHDFKRVFWEQQVRSYV